MMKFNKLRSIAASVAVVLAAAAMSFTGCISSDDLLGSNMLPNNQEMTSGTIRLARAKQFFETRLYQTDSIKSSNLGVGYFGIERNDTTGLVDAGFLSQYLPYYHVDSGYFGYRPIFDSAQLLLSVASFGRDTLTPQLFNVYEVTTSDYLTGSDSVFYIRFDPSKYISQEPLFTFTYPNGTTTGPATRAVKMTPTARGRDFVNRLMISDGTNPYQEGVDYTIYTDDKKFLQAFQGLCIRPSDPSAMAVGKGSVFGTDLTASGFSIHCRNRVESDPTLINDTVGAVYYFSNTDFSNRNQSINFFGHDYTGTGIEIDQVKETVENRPLSASILVSGMGGVISELTLTQEFFDALEEVITTHNADKGTHFTTLAMNRALLTIYFTGSDYAWDQVDVDGVIPLMSVALARFGSYANYKKVTAIADYDYYGEQNYNYTLAYGGYINRSQACYALDISGYLQQVWNNYLKQKRTSADGQVDLSKVENRSFFLGPDAYGYFTTRFAKVQGMDLEGNKAPVKIDLTYTLIK